MNSLRTIVLVAATAAATALTVVPGPALATPSNGERPPPVSTVPADWSAAVTQACAGALLFEHAHHTSTHADALAVARDIRASTARRLSLVRGRAVPPELQRLAGRWFVSQRQLAGLYARSWVRIYDAIAAARTPPQHARLAQRLERLVHAPDALKLVAGRLELELHVPDCTGGG